MRGRDVQGENAKLRAEVEELRREATTDGLSGLLNHRAFYSRLAAERQRAARHSRALALVMFDLDAFKSLNDVYGHPVGDRALRLVARSLREQARAGDALARIGGDEFAVIAPDTDAAAGLRLGERLRAAAVNALASAGLASTLSAGVADLAVANTVDELVRCADEALYHAKRRGGDQTVLYTRAAIREISYAEALSERVLSVARAMNSALAAKDWAAREHAEAVARVAGYIATRLGWNAERRTRLREAALLHDVDKLTVPETLLRKYGPYTPEEREQIKQHPALGARIVEGLLDDEQTSWVRGHHERSDGQGYPDGLAGEDVPDGARIIAVADAYDAMTRVAVNGNAINPADAVAELRRCAGSQFDPAAVDAITDWLSDSGELQTRRAQENRDQTDTDAAEEPRS